MKTKIFIVTYKNRDAIKKCIKSIFSSDVDLLDYQIYVINNYQELDTNQLDTLHNVKVLNNATRADFSFGHLARNWNQALINGFQDLKNPDCELVVCLQDDTIVKPDCFSKIIELHKKYDFYQGGVGDQIMTFNANAVRRIGIFDERFCAVGVQEQEYYRRAIRLHSDKVSISDVSHNPIVPNIPGRYYDLGEGDKSPSMFHLVEQWRQGDHTQGYDRYLLALLNGKFFSGHETVRFFTYPYFEIDIETLEEQNYFGINLLDNPNHNWWSHGKEKQDEKWWD